MRTTFGRALRWSAAAVLATTAFAAAPALAAGRPVTTHVVAHLAPSTALVGSVVTVSGTVSPRSAVPLTLQRLVGRTWHSVVVRKAGSDGAYVLSVRVPKKAATWVLRVGRGPSTGAKAGISKTLHLHVVPTAFAVTSTAPASVGAGLPLPVVGTVSPRATGSVSLQSFVGGGWQSLATARLTSTSTFAFSTVEPSGSYRLRVVKAFSSTVAAGSGQPLTVVVGPAPPTVTTVLPGGTTREPYAVTLTATGGVGPYTWTAAGLPAGLGVTSAGALSGTPLVAGTSSVLVVVTDSGGRTGTAVLALVVAHAAGTLWAWGNDVDGALGNGGTTDSDVPVAVNGLTGVAAAAAFNDGGYALLANGTVWSWGFNGQGQLGNGSGAAQSDVPVQVDVAGVTAIAGGANTGYALLADGTLVAWGGNGNGEVGNGTISGNILQPVPVVGLTDVTAVDGCASDAYALRSDGTVWAWGYNGDGELGNVAAPANSGTPVQVSGLTGVVAVAAGGLLGCSGYALRSDGTVWAWGTNGEGELGNGSTTNAATPVQVSGLTGVTAIAGGGENGYALRSDGTVWGWGFNGSGQLGNGGTVSSTVPVEVTGLTGVTAIAADADSAFALRSDGTVVAWGRGSHGTLGDGTAGASSSPVEVSGLTGAFAVAGDSGSDSGYAIELGR